MLKIVVGVTGLAISAFLRASLPETAKQGKHAQPLAMHAYRFKSVSSAMQKKKPRGPNERGFSLG